MLNLVPASEKILEAYSSLKTKIPEVAGSFVVDSDRVVLKLLESELEVESVLATPEWYEEHAPHLRPHSRVTFYVAPRAVLASIVGFTLHQGVMARARTPSDVELSTLAQAPLLALDGVTKAENVGAIIRNAGAFGVWGMLLSHDSCHPYNRRAARTAMGNLFRMRVHQSPSLPQALRELKAQGVTVYAFENRPFAQSLDQIRFASRAALVIGSEGAGISEEVLQVADHFVRIPIDDYVYALNAACASAVGLYAFSRQIEGPAAE